MRCLYILYKSGTKLRALSPQPTNTQRYERHGVLTAARVAVPGGRHHVTADNRSRSPNESRSRLVHIFHWQMHQGSPTHDMPGSAHIRRGERSSPLVRQATIEVLTGSFPSSLFFKWLKGPATKGVLPLLLCPISHDLLY